MDVQKLLIVYSGTLTAAVAIAMLTGAAPGLSNKMTLQELDVQRINVREPDGTLRMTLSGAKRIPGLMVKDKEYPLPNRTGAGILFFNEEGTETGGLIFSGREVNGKVESMGSLTFDRYEQDQVVQVLELEDGDRRFAGLQISDRPEGKVNQELLRNWRQRPRSEWAAIWKAANAGEAHRITIARTNDKSANVSLKDSGGRERLVLRVTEDGAASIEFKDAAGKVVRTIRPE